MADPFDYFEARADADELIDDFGQTIAIRRVTNTGTAWAPTQAPQDYTTFAARIEFSQAQIASGDVQVTDTRWMISAGPLVALSVEPQQGDFIVVGGVAIGRVLSCDPINPAGIAVAYDLHVRV